MAEDFEVASRKLAKALAAYPDAVGKHARRALFDAGHDWRGAMLDRFRAPLPKPGNTNTTLHSRPGARLKRSLTVKVEGQGLDARLTLSSRGVPYAAAQEFGAVIRPRRAKYLTVPLPAAMTPAGGLRRSASEWFRQSEPGEVFIKKSKAGNLVIYLRKQSKPKLAGFRGDIPFAKVKEKIVALFLLKKQITIPGPKSTGAKSRFGFFRTWDLLEADRDLAFELAEDRAIEETFRRTL